MIYVTYIDMSHMPLGERSSRAAIKTWLVICAKWPTWLLHTYTSYLVAASIHRYVVMLYIMTLYGKTRAIRFVGSDTNLFVQN